MKLSITSLFKKKYKTKLEEVIDKTGSFKNELFKKSYSSNLSLINIETTYFDITTYTKELNKFYQAMCDDRVVYNIELPNNTKTITLFEFFLDEKDNYIDSIVAGEEFFGIVNKYLTKYLEVEKDVNRTFNNNRNLLVLNELTTNTINIASTIIEVL